MMEQATGTTRSDGSKLTVVGVLREVKWGRTFKAHLNLEVSKLSVMLVKIVWETSRGRRRQCGGESEWKTRSERLPCRLLSKHFGRRETGGDAMSWRWRTGGFHGAL